MSAVLGAHFGKPGSLMVMEAPLVIVARVLRDRKLLTAGWINSFRVLLVGVQSSGLSFCMLHGWHMMRRDRVGPAWSGIFREEIASGGSLRGHLHEAGPTSHVGQVHIARVDGITGYVLVVNR
jgi:hypothetical protein